MICKVAWTVGVSVVSRHRQTSRIFSQISHRPTQFSTPTRTSNYPPPYSGASSHKPNTSYLSSQKYILPIHLPNMKLCDLGKLKMDLLKPFEEPDLRISMSHNLSSETEEELSASERRRYKSFTVMQRTGFQHTEYVQIMIHLCKAEIIISLAFLIHGASCPGYPDEAEYQSTCHMNTVAALVGLVTGGLGLGAVHRYRWRTMLMMWLVCCIISAVGNLLAVITTGIWLDHLSKMKDRTGVVNGLSGFMLLASVAVGVCFILTAVMICHYWNSNSPKYQPVGKIAKRARSVRRRLSRVKSGEKKETPKPKPDYHIV